GAPRVLSRRCGDARVRPRQTLAAVAAVEDRPRLEARRVEPALRGQSPVIQGLHPARTTRPPVDLQDPRGRGPLSLGLVEGLAMAAPAGDGEARRHAGEAL